MLKKYISNELLEQIVKNNDECIIYDFMNNIENSIRIIDLFKDIGIKNIDLLLINRLEIFCYKYEDIIDRLDKFDIKSLVELINNDINTINVI